MTTRAPFPARHGAWLAVLAVICGCNDGSASPADAVTAADTLAETTPDTVVFPTLSGRDGFRVRMAFDRGRGLFDAPVPALDLHRTQPVAGVSRKGLADWPGAAADPYVGPILELVLASDGAASLGGAWFLPLAGLDDATRASLHAGSGERLSDFVAMHTAGIGLVVFGPHGDLTPAPFEWHFDTDGGPFGTPDMLVLKPISGLPLPPASTCAAFVTATFARRFGAEPGRDDGLADLLSGRRTVWSDGWTSDEPLLATAAHDEQYQVLASTLAAALAIPAADLVGLVVARTGDPAATFLSLAAAALAATFEASDEAGPGDDAGHDLRPELRIGPFEFHTSFDTFCVFAATARIPDFQHGTPPFMTPGDGMWRVGDDGLTPRPARSASSRVFVAIPRKPMPDKGVPLALFVRTGGGGDRPLIDRGFRPVAGGPSDPETGAGPALELAAAGWAALTWDGPHGGLRNVSNGDEQFLMFNILNPAAARANIWQTALEAAMLRRYASSPDGLAGLTTCPGDVSSAPVVFDSNHHAIIGHSMGAWIAPLALALDKDLGAAVLSGAGGGWIENIVYKQKPIVVRPLAETILGYGGDRSLTVFDPALTLLQWAGEAADPQVFGMAAMTPPRHLLIVQGVVDRYILPPIADALQLALGVDLAGPALDADLPELMQYQPFSAGLALVGRTHRPFPVAANRDGKTAVVVHHPEDGIEDGHEAFFQQLAARRHHRCFLDAIAAGRPPVVDGDDITAPCR